MVHQRKAYAGVLAEPVIVPDEPPRLASYILDQDHGTARYEAWWKEAWRVQYFTAMQKMPALFAHYGLEMSGDGDWVKLAINLAFDHVPGFQAKQEHAGKPSKQADFDRRMKTYCRVRYLMETEGLGPEQACKRLAHEHRDYRKMAFETIYKQYQRAQKGAGVNLIQVLDHFRADPRIGPEVYRIYLSAHAKQ